MVLDNVLKFYMNSLMGTEVIEQKPNVMTWLKLNCLNMLLFTQKQICLNTSLPHRKNKNSTIILSNGGHLRLQLIGLVYGV